MDKMQSEKKIRKMCNDWIKLKKQMVECGDTVSLIVADHADFYINAFQWVLKEGKYGK